MAVPLLAGTMAFPQVILRTALRAFFVEDAEKPRPMRVFWQSLNHSGEDSAL